MDATEQEKIKEAVQQTVKKMEGKYKQKIKEERKAIMEEASKLAAIKEEPREHKILLIEFYDIKELTEESNKLLNMTKDFDKEKKDWNAINLPDNTAVCQLVGFLARETENNIYIAKKKLGDNFYNIHTVPKEYIIKTEEL